jgi:hypothetical protein
MAWKVYLRVYQPFLRGVSAPSKGESRVFGQKH